MFFRYQKTYLYAGRYLTWQAVFQVLLCQIEIVWECLKDIFDGVSL